MSPRPPFIGLLALLALGCARSAADAEPLELPAAQETGEDEAASEEGEPEDAEAPADAPADDPEAEHISFEGPDAEPGPSEQVVAPPQRPPMPSMMTDVLKTGPRL